MTDLSKTTPLIDRDALRNLLRIQGVTSGRSYTRHELSRYRDDVTDAVMELARPMPTQEQLAEVIEPVLIASGHDDGEERRWEALELADAVLALVNGTS